MGKMVKIFVSYKDDNNQIVKGYFSLIKETDNYIRIQSGKNEITIPYHRIIKVKKEVKDKI